MDNEEFDDIETLKDEMKQKKTKLSDKQRAELHKEVQEVMERIEKEEKERRRAEMERLYERGLYA